MFRDDWLIRQIDGMAAVIMKVTRMREREDYEAAFVEADRGWDGLGVRRELALVVDVPTLAEMLRTPKAMRAAVELLRAEADVEAARRDDTRAALLRARATQLDELQRVYRR